jgi:hypothetical protein
MSHVKIQMSREKRFDLAGEDTILSDTDEMNFLVVLL